MISISIIIPTFNRSSTIDYCLQSVLNQTSQNFEIIVVDDCSSDNTVEIANSIKDNRIRTIVLDKNLGAQAARNVGIKNAKYDWIAFHDSDDEWLPDKLEKQIKELEKVNFQKDYVIHGDCFVFDHVKNFKTNWSLPLVNGVCYKQLLTSPAPVFPAILASKEALIKINFLDENVPSWQEWDTSIRLSKICSFIHIQEPLFIYHKHKETTISKNKMVDIIGYQYIINKNKNKIISVCGFDVWRQHLQTQANKFMKSNLFEDGCQKPLEKAMVISLINEILADYSELAIPVWKNRYFNIKNSRTYKLGKLFVKPFAYFRKSMG